MKIRWIVYVLVGLLVVVYGDMLNQSMDTHFDYAWLIIAAAAFAFPPEIAGFAGLLFGLTLDGISGGGTMVYTISYGGIGALLVIIRKTFFFEGIIAGWLSAIVGAEVLWLFIVLLSKAVRLLGVAVAQPGLISPFLLSIIIGYPFVHLLTQWVLPKPSEGIKRSRYASVDKTPG
ncbi:MAG TPA: hypothetical protein VGB30_11675 [bacterium]|jgi:hypothetical protein